MKSDTLSPETTDNNIYALDYFEVDATDAFKLKYYLLSWMVYFWQIDGHFYASDMPTSPVNNIE